MSVVDTNETLPENENTKKNDKELNFRRQEAMYQKMMEEKEQRIAQLEREALERQQLAQQAYEQEDDDEPYIDKKRLAKTLSSFEKSMEDKIEKKADQRARALLAEEKKANWMKANPDFYDVMNHAEEFAKQYPDLAEEILNMPEGFERQKLVYKNIKSLKVHEPKKESIQETVNKNMRSPYYQPSSVGSAPYQGYVAGSKDYSTSEKQNAYEQLQQLKSRLRIG